MLGAHVAEVRAMIAEWQNGRERLRATRTNCFRWPPSARGDARRIPRRQGQLVDVLAARRNEIDVRLQALQLGPRPRGCGRSSISVSADTPEPRARRASRNAMNAVTHCRAGAAGVVAGYGLYRLGMQA